FTPVMVGQNAVTGTVDLVVSAVKKVDVCQPTNNCIAVSAFSTQFDCKTDKDVAFVNLSTYGTAISYEWDFGYNNQKSTAIAPKFYYPALSTDASYTVRLVVKNNDCNKSDTSYETITIPARPGVNLGPDTVLCTNGGSLALNASSHSGTTYLWNNGLTTPTRTVSTTGTTTAWVELTFNNCNARDTINVWINPIAKRSLQTRAICSAAVITLDASRGQNETYKWNTGEVTRDIKTNVPGYYWCDLYLNGCIVRDSFLVISPSVSQSTRTITVCQKDMPYAADATISGASAYNWSDNNTNARRNLATPGLWWVDVTISGCTVRDSIQLSVDSFKIVTTSARICGGQQYSLPSGKMVNTSALHRDTLRNIRGCDSLITNITLTVDTVKRVSSNVSICAGQSYTLPSGKSVTVAGLYADTVRYTLSNCDSLVTNLTLTVATVARISQTATICVGSSYRLPSGKNVSNAAIYLDTLKAQAGCDSIIYTIDLKVDMPNIVNRTVTICNGSSYILPSGKAVTVAGLYRDTVRNVRSCDSLITNLTTRVDMVTTLPVNAYFYTGQSYTLPWGATTTTGGIYRDTVKSAAGCDSL
ncbi:MAG TPA: hypothetical protein VEC93_01025, partial [Anaerolineae bacterium]|nr:hypothetical protein [Anaerolineae bacterium]